MKTDSLPVGGLPGPEEGRTPAEFKILPKNSAGLYNYSTMVIPSLAWGSGDLLTGSIPPCVNTSFSGARVEPPQETERERRPSLITSLVGSPSDSK